MAIPTTVRLNGFAFSRKSVSVRPNGALRLTGVDSINWSDEVPTELVGGLNDQGIPLGMVPGQYTCSASMGVYLDEVNNFEAMVLAGSPLAGTNLNAAVFQLPIVIREDVRVKTVALVNCRIKGREVSVGNDGAALVQLYQLQPLVVVSDGKSLVNLLPAI